MPMSDVAMLAAGASTAEVVVFWVFGVLAVGSAIAVISLRNVVHAALMLVLNLVAIAALYVALESSFLAIVQVLVYAGAIMVLFLFVIMLLGVRRDDLLVETRARSRLVAALGGVLLVSVLLFAFAGAYTTDASRCGPDAPVAVEAGQVRCAGLADAYGEDDASGVAFLGLRMFTRHTWSFELAALLLTVATIGAVVLARRRDLTPEDVDEGVDPVGDEPLLADGADREDDATAPAGAGAETENGEG